MAKKKADAVKTERIVEEVIARESWPFWIYPGERRPVIVQARNERHAKHKVSESPEYDGFPVYVMPVHEFSGRCAPKGGGTDLPEVPGEESVSAPAQDRQEIFLAVKVVDGLIERVESFASKDVSIAESDKIAQHLSAESDDLRVFRLATDFIGTPGGREVAKEIYSATMQE